MGITPVLKIHFQPSPNPFCSCATQPIWFSDHRSPSSRHWMHLKWPEFPKGESESLYRRDSPWISNYHIQNSFQLDITDIQHWKSLHGFIYYITQRVVVRKSESKPLGLKGSKQEMVAVASLRAFLHLELHLYRQNLSIARASKLQLYHPSSLASNSWISSWIFLETFFFETWHMCVC